MAKFSQIWWTLFGLGIALVLVGGPTVLRPYVSSLAGFDASNVTVVADPGLGELPLLISATVGLLLIGGCVGFAIAKSVRRGPVGPVEPEAPED